MLVEIGSNVMATDYIGGTALDEVGFEDAP